MVKLPKEPKESGIGPTERKELESVLATLSGRLDEFKDKVGPVVQIFEEMKDDVESDDVVEYLRVKQQLLLSYVTNLVFYVQLKLKGECCSDHPVMSVLLGLRYAMEKMRPLDGKLKYQIDRLVKLVEMGEQEQTSSTLRPNPSALLAKDDDEDGGSGHNDDDSGDEENKSRRGSALIAGGDGIYRPPRMESARYDDAEAKAERQEEKLKQKRKKIKNSEIFDALREEFTSAPEASTSTGMSSMSGLEKKLKADAQERTAFEEDRFVRMTMTKKEKQAIKKKEREVSQNNVLSSFGANVDDLDDLVSSFKEISDAAGADRGSKRKTGVGVGGRGNFADSDGDDDMPVQRPRGKSKVAAAAAAAGSEDAMARAAMMFSHASRTGTDTLKKRKKSKR